MSLYTQLVRDEGNRPIFYQDSRGNWTVGIGHKGSTPLTQFAINQILNDDIASHTNDLLREAPWLRGLSLVRLNALINMAFTMGVWGVFGFHDMLDCLRVGDYAGAAEAIRDSAWAKVEAPARAARIAKQMELDVEQ